MYKEAASLGIDLMGYDSNDSAIKRRNRRKAVVLLGTGQSVPEKLKKRLIKKDIPQSGKKKISVKKCGQIILLVLQGRICRQECSIRLPSGMKDISQLPHRIQSIRSNRWSLLFVRRSAHWAGSDIYGLQNIFQKVERIWKPGCWKQKRKYVVVQLLSTTEKVRIEIASFTYCNYMLIYLYKHFSFRNIFIRWNAKQMSKRKGFSKLNLLNRFLFNETMEDPENPKYVTETLKDITGGGSHFLSLICFVIGGVAILLGLVRVWSVITLLWKSSRCEDL